MIQILVEIPKTMAAGFEDRLMDMVVPSWTIREDRQRHLHDLIGYFDSEDEGLKSYNVIRAAFPQLSEHPAISTVVDRDWKEAYKEHFRPWSTGGLHWVPMWLKDKYPVPTGENAIYLDPGMAFGTGNHETTRLCAMRLMEAAREWGSNVSDLSVIDAGCGSGILAISASKLGFGTVSAFDIDVAAVQIASENATANGLSGTITFNACDLGKGLEDKHADVILANILANVLVQNADVLLKAVNPGGRIVLSGILATEVGDVKAVFEKRARDLWGTCEMRSRIDGEWADILLGRSANYETK
jgi:ribosomal protein L11 methyltransferase